MWVHDATGRAGANFVGALLSALDRRLANEPDELAKLEAIANQSTVLSANRMYIATSLRFTDVRLDGLTEEVRQKLVTPAETVVISYGRGLAEVSPAALSRFIRALVDRGDEGGAWAALEILSMVTHAAKALSPDMIELVKLALLSPSIADGVEGNASNANYNYDRMFRLVDAAGAIDASFARAFALQIQYACRTTGGRGGRSSDALRAALPIVIQRTPTEVWPVLAGFYEIATRIERERLNSIISATKLFAYDVSRTGAGALFGTPLKFMLDWVKGDPDTRISFLLTFFPILEQKGDTFIWHPALQQLAGLYGGRKRFKDALRQRVYPSSWGGSLNAHLTSFKEPLASWTKHRLLGDWATSMLDNVERSLAENSYGR